MAEVYTTTTGASGRVGIRSRATRRPATQHRAASGVDRRIQTGRCQERHFTGAVAVPSLNTLFRAAWRYDPQRGAGLNPHGEIVNGNILASLAESRCARLRTYLEQRAS